MKKDRKGLGWLAAVLVPAGLMAAPAAASAQGFQCGANNPLTQNTRPQVDEDRKTDSGTLDRDRVMQALAKADGTSSTGKRRSRN